MNAVVQHQGLVTAQISQLAEVLGLHNIDPLELKQTLIQTAFKSDKEISDAQMGALMIVASQYKLNPWNKEIYAFPDKNKGIIPVVGVDGWSRIINSNPNLNGIEFVFSTESVHPNKAKVDCPTWVDCIIYRKDRDRPTIVREYLDEVYREPMGQNGYAGPWQSHPKRFLRHKALIQCARLAFGFVGIYDQDEAERIQESGTVKTVHGQTSNVVPDGYQAFEDEQLPFFQTESQYGTERLSQAHATLPKNTWAKHFWTIHSADLKAIAELADQALTRQGETYDHSPA